MDDSIKVGYTAGIIDGEGSFNFTKQQPSGYPQPRLSIENLSLDLLVWLKDTWGGSILTHKRLSASGRTLYQYTVSSTNLTDMLELVTEHLICKKDQAQLILDFWHLRRRGRGRGPVTNSERDLDQEYADILPALRSPHLYGAHL
jgi:hypothetical protein